MKKSLFLLSILASCFGAFGQLTNDSFNLESYYGDLLMRRHVAGDLVWKRALVTGTNQLVVNYGGDYTNGTRISGPQLLVDGNLGIGTTNLKAKASIFGGNGFFTNPTLELKSASNEFAWALLQLKGGTFDDKADYMIGRGTPNYNQGRALTFHIPSRKDFYNGSGTLPQISFVSSGANTLGYVQSETGNWYMKGNVGIGTTTPSSKLHVKGQMTIDKDNAGIILDMGKNLPVGSRNFRWTRGNGTTDKGVYFFARDMNGKVREEMNHYTNRSYWTLNDKNQANFFKIDEGSRGENKVYMHFPKPDSRIVIGSWGTYLEDKGHKLVVKDGSAMIENAIYTNGEIGIGTNAPERKLDIRNGGVLVKGEKPNFKLESTIPGYGSWVDIAPAHCNGCYSKFAKKGSIVMRAVSYNGDFYITNPGNTGITFATGNWNSSNNPQKERMTITNTGNVGIGTLTPDSKLAVNGNIHAKEVTVDLVGWPDYVFENKYNLPTLQQVEHHIKEKGHLINIPSAVEVAKKGIQLGEMNKKLLEKIEELTLYTIAQEKKLQKIEVLEAKNTLLEDRLAKIEALLQKQ